KHVDVLPVGNRARSTFDVDEQHVLAKGTVLSSRRELGLACTWLGIDRHVQSPLVRYIGRLQQPRTKRGRDERTCLTRRNLRWCFDCCCAQTITSSTLSTSHGVSSCASSVPYPLLPSCW